MRHAYSSHVLIAQVDGWPLPGVVKSWKSFTAKAINRALDRDARVWAKNYFDRFMRDAEQFEATLAYVEGNPVKAGLCREPGDWRWSSAAGRRRWDVAGRIQRSVDWTGDVPSPSLAGFAWELTVFLTIY